MIQKLVALAACLLLVLPLSSCGVFGISTPLPDYGGREVTVAVENSHPPFNSLNPDTGEGWGWDYDMMRELGRRLNFTPVFVETPWEQILSGVAAGDYDMAADGITITAERAASVAFSDPYMILDQRVVIRSDETRATTLREWQAQTELRVGAKPATTNYEAAAAYFGEDRVATYATTPALIEALITGEVDAVVLDDVAYQSQHAAYPDRIDRLPGTLYGNLLGFAFPQDSDLIEGVNAALQEMILDGTLEEITRFWIAEPS